MLGDDLLRWAADVSLPGGSVVKVDTLREPWGPWMLHLARDGDALDVVLKAATPDRLTEFTCEVTALRFAEEHGLPAPRLVAADLSGSLGPIAFVCSAMKGDSTVPVVPTVERLQAAGAAAAVVHRVPLRPREALPLRTRQMPWIDFSEERRAGRSPTTDLLHEVDTLLAATSPPPTETVLVHGDLWQGNLLFDGDVCVGIIDWEATGAGDPGIDIGSLRWDAAILFGAWASDHILSGWEFAAGRVADHVAYWDLVAGANTPADLSAMVDSITQQGRADLDGETLTNRRDRFLEDALDNFRS